MENMATIQGRTDFNWGVDKIALATGNRNSEREGNG